MVGRWRVFGGLRHRSGTGEPRSEDRPAGRGTPGKLAGAAGWRLELSLVGSRAAEDVRHRVVPLVTRILEHSVLGMAFERQRDLPGTDPDLRICDRRLVLNGVRVDAGQTFDQSKVPAGRCRVAVPREPDLAVEVGRFD